VSAAPERPFVLDLSSPRRVHVVAVGGAGMSGIATILAQQGHSVTGSDLVEGPAIASLRDLGVRVVIGHDPAQVDGGVAVVVSTAVPAHDPEVTRAHELGIPVLSRRDLLPAFAAVQPFVSISGTHGKTTTSSMTAAVLRGVGADPSFLVGARVPVLGAAAGSGSGDWFVLEADESDGSFQAGPRAAALVTNVEADHLEFWGGWDQLCEGFETVLAGTGGPTLVCADDPEARRIGERIGAAAYGTHHTAAHRILDLQLDSHGSTFRFRSAGAEVDVHLAVPGRHNALNAAGALALAVELGVDPAAAAGALGDYTGVARRFEDRGHAAGVQLVDDYAHLPTEVRAALAAGRSGDWGRVVAVFQPHRYSRTQALWHDFADAFADADLVVLTEIYAAGEEPRPGITGRLLVDAVRDAHPDAALRWSPTLDDVVAFLAQELRPGDLCLSIGAGDVTTLADRVLPVLRARERAGAGSDS
jgi:UDP-N-acetylmuramate--alanine ligase